MYIAIGIAAVIALVLIIASMRPAEFSVSRSGTMTATPEAVFAHVNNLHNWQEWSPWAKLDPNAKTYYEGPEAGVGAVFGWSGNMKIGTGKMTIIESRPAEVVRIRLDFVRPMKCTNTAEFALKAGGNQTTVTWTTSGKMGLMGKVFGLFMNCDKMMGCHFEKGLAQLKAIVESAPKSSPAMSNA